MSDPNASGKRARVQFRTVFDRKAGKSSMYRGRKCSRNIPCPTVRLIFVCRIEQECGNPCEIVDWVLIKSWWHEHDFLGYILQVLLAEMLPEVKYLGI